MEGLFKADTLRPTGFAKMTNPAEIKDKITRTLKECDQTYLDLGTHPLCMKRPEVVTIHREAFKKLVAEIAIQADHVMAGMNESGCASEVDRLMLDFVIAKAWGNYHSLSRQMNNQFFSKDA